MRCNHEDAVRFANLIENTISRLEMVVDDMNYAWSRGYPYTRGCIELSIKQTLNAIEQVAKGLFTDMIELEVVSVHQREEEEENGDAVIARIRTLCRPFFLQEQIEQQQVALAEKKTENARKREAEMERVQERALAAEKKRSHKLLLK